MAATKSNTIALPADLVVAAEQYAQEARLTVDELAEMALRFYIDADPELNAIRRAHKERAAALGLTPEEYVDYIVHEERRERHSAA